MKNEINQTGKRFLKLKVKIKAEPVILMMSSQEKPFLHRYMTIVALDINEKYYNNIKFTGM